MPTKYTNIFPRSYFFGPEDEGRIIFQIAGN
jgi:hypothetical protein